MLVMNGSDTAGMADKIDAFPTPSFLSLDGSSGGANFGLSNVASVFPVIFAIVFFIWVVYTLVIAYHWLRYGHRSFLAVPLLALHLIVSGALMVLATAGLR